MNSSNEVSVLGTEDIKSFEKKSSFNLNCKIKGVQVLDNGSIACFTLNGVKILKINSEHKFELVKELTDYKDYGEKISIQDDDGCLIFSSGNCKEKFKVLDREFNLVQEDGLGPIITLCKLGDSRISQANDNMRFVIFTKKDGMYTYSASYETSEGNITCQIFFPKQNLLVNGHNDNTITVFDLSKEEFILRIPYAHDDPVSELVRIDDELFVSGSRDFKIKFWNIKEITNGNTDPNYTIRAHDEYDGEFMKLIRLSDNFYVSAAGFYFKIWNQCNCERQLEEDSKINFLCTTNSHDLLTFTEDNQVHLWKK